MIGLQHIGVTVRDLDSAVTFYSAALGTAPVVRRVFDAPYTADQIGYPGAKLDVAHLPIPGGPIILELIQYLHPAGTPVDTETKNAGTWHLCMEVSDVGVEFDRLCELGAKPRSSAPVEITSGPNAGRQVAYLRDPEGLTIELMEARSDPGSSLSQ